MASEQVHLQVGGLRSAHSGRSEHTEAGGDPVHNGITRQGSFDYRPSGGHAFGHLGSELGSSTFPSNSYYISNAKRITCDLDSRGAPRHRPSVLR